MTAAQRAAAGLRPASRAGPAAAARPRTAESVLQAWDSPRVGHVPRNLVGEPSRSPRLPANRRPPPEPGTQRHRWCARRADRRRAVAPRTPRSGEETTAATENDQISREACCTKSGGEADSRPRVVGVPLGPPRLVRGDIDGGRQRGDGIGRGLRRHGGDDGRAAGERGRGVAVVILVRLVVTARRGGHRRRGRHQRADRHGGQQGRADPEHEGPPPPTQHAPMVAQSGRHCTSSMSSTPGSFGDGRRFGSAPEPPSVRRARPSARPVVGHPQ